MFDYLLKYCSCPLSSGVTDSVNYKEKDLNKMFDNPLFNEIMVNKVKILYLY